MRADITALGEDLNAVDDIYGVLEMVNYKTTTHILLSLTVL